MTIEWYKQFYKNETNISKMTKEQIHIYEKIGERRKQLWAS